MTHKRAEEYRELAQQCLDLAWTLPSGAATALTDTAEMWLKFAREQEAASAPLDKDDDE